MTWKSNNEWRGQEAFIIGGGSSLHNFDFKKLAGRNTVGCNEAFRLGDEIVKICLFGDSSWFQKSKWDLESGRGQMKVLSVSVGLEHLRLPWLWHVSRAEKGFYSGGSVVGWNYSTGAAAISLAVNLGASRIFLLGFDSNPDSPTTHWHNRYPKRTEAKSIIRFMKGYKVVADGVNKLGVEVLNVTDGTTRIDVFPRISFQQMDQLLERSQAA